jgi:hypothetical protein
MAGQQITLREERNGADIRYLTASLSDAGDLVLDGQDLGPSTPDGDEYEWVRTIRAEHIPLLRAAGEIPNDADLLATLAERYSGIASYDLERLLADGEIPNELFVF